MPELPWQRVRRAVVVVDLVESVRLMERHEAAMIATWRTFLHAARTQLLPRRNGRMVKSLGDGMLLAFAEARDAVATVHALHELARGTPLVGGHLPLQLRAGVTLSEVVEDALDLYGAGVNLAARLAASPQPGGTWVDADVRDELVSGVDADIEDLGDLYLKHLTFPVHAYALTVCGQIRAPSFHAPVDLRPAVAVVPFQCRDGSDPRSVLGDLLVDEVGVRLARCDEWRLISRLSSAACAGRTLAPDVLGSTLGADYLCTGAYQVHGGQFSVQAQLVFAPTGEALWGTSGQAHVVDLLAGQSTLVQELGSGVAEAILGHGMQAVTSTPLPHLRSHELMLGAMALMHRTRRADFGHALDIIDHLEQRHPRAAQPSAWRAKWHVLRVVQGWSEDPVHDGELALQAGRRAVAADGRSSLALTMQGLVHAYLHSDFDAARDCYDGALAQNPHEGLALLLRGTMHAFMGEGAPAYAQTQEALRLSPLDPLRYFYLSLAASAAISDRRYDDAIALAEASLRLNRVHLSTYRSLAMAQSLAGRVSEASATVTQLLRLDPSFTTSRFRSRFPGRERAPEFTTLLADALERAGVPA